MTLETIRVAADPKYKTMQAEFIATVETTNGKVVQYGFLDQLNGDFVVRRADGRVDLLNSDSIVCIWVDLKGDYDV